MELAHYALPLFSLIKRPDGGADLPIPDTLADDLQAHLQVSVGIKAVSAKILLVKGEPHLLLREVAPESLPALCSLADVQKTVLLRYERRGEAEATLTPVMVDPGDG